jgi:hypothetical protein
MAGSAIIGLGGCVWVSELLFDVMVEATMVASGVDSHRKGDMSEVLQAPVLMAWHYLPASARAALVAANCQLLESLAATAPFASLPAARGAIVRIANARATLLGLLRYQLSHWDQQPCSWTLTTTQAILSCETVDGSELSGSALPVEWIAVLANSSSVEGLPGASTFAGIAEALKVGAPVMIPPAGMKAEVSVRAASAAIAAARASRAWDSLSGVLSEMTHSSVGELDAWRLPEQGDARSWLYSLMDRLVHFPVSREHYCSGSCACLLNIISSTYAVVDGGK